LLLFLSLPLDIAISKRAVGVQTNAARLSLMFICMSYLIGCREGKSAPIRMTLFVALFLARPSSAQGDPAPTRDAAP